MRVDFFATHEKDGIKYARGHALPYGATHYGEGIVNFSINSVHAKDCTLVLYHKGEMQPFVEIDIPDDFKIGDNYSIMVFDLNIEEVEYGYKFGGEYNPSKGLYFNKNKVMLDPYAKLISGCDIWMKPEYDYYNFPMRGRILQNDYEWDGDKPLNRPMEDTVIYEMHVRGFTKQANDVKYPGTYAGLIRKIPYLKKLGVNCIELLPVFEFYENDLLPSFDEYGNMNVSHGCIYWGYATIGFFAPKAGYAQLGPRGMAADEFKNMVKKLHQNGIEIILDVVFNHVGEWYINEEKDMNFHVNFAGIDNPTYYMLNQDGSYADYTGCNNTVNCNHPIVRNMILDCLRYWVSEYHIDGFRFDEAPILSRDANGAPMANPPLLEALAMDPILSKTKLIAEAWDAGGLYQLGSFPAPKRWAEWNGKFRDCVRGFMRSDEHAGRELIQRLQGSPDIFYHKNAGSGVNFVTCHDGFTLMDNVSYNDKHNWNNNDLNRDGIGNNVSWNSGWEGETDNQEINDLRRRNIKNAQAIMMVSRGTPMLLAGDEFGNTQWGNNNSFCQDNEVSWLDWSLAEKNADMVDFVSKMTALRMEHPVMRRADFFSGHNSTGYPEISFHGTQPWNIDTNRPQLTFGMMYAESAQDYPVDHDTFIYIGLNAYWEHQTMELPILPEGFVWQKYVDTADYNHNDRPDIWGNYGLRPRSMVILTAVKR